jgi:Ca2+-binding EF-hand superfamily protein
MLPSRSLQDEMLKNYIETVFNRYDTDKNGTLDVQEMTSFFNDLFRQLQIGVTVTEQQSIEAIRSID